MLKSPDRAWWTRHLASVPLPRWVGVRQRFPREREPDLAAAVHRELDRPEARSALTPGAKVAIGIGSRGLAGLFELTKATVEVLTEAGCHPFIVSAMGSHGGATADGQQHLLAGYGITEDALGVPVRSSLEVAELGRLANGMPVYFDRLALDADLVLPLNRVKSHTSFRGPIESGLSKMLVIGLANHAGAQAIHAYGYDRFAANLLEARELLLPQVPFHFGLATVENAYGEVARVEAVSAASLPAREPELLLDSRRLQARLPTDDLDLLVVSELGKDVSGLGMDPSITGRYAGNLVGEVRAKRLLVLDLTSASGGNAIGLGLADVTTERALLKVDLAATWINATTSTSVAAARLPIFMPSDRTALQLAVKTSGEPDAARIRAVWIRNTSSLESVLVSEGLWQELEGRGDLEVQSGKGPSFDESGALEPLWE